MINQNLHRLRRLLEKATEEERSELGKTIGAGFGNTPELLCDHMNFLRAGFIGQIFDKRSYKQLVTDVADRIHINWASLVSGSKSWHDLRTAEIETAIVKKAIEDSLDNMPENEIDKFVIFLETEIGEKIKNIITTIPVPRPVKIPAKVITYIIINCPYLLAPLFPTWNSLAQGIMQIHVIRCRIEG